MAFKIGFGAEHPEDNSEESASQSSSAPIIPRKSVVQVYFADRNRTLAYYNDCFDLHCGDMVYVDGKLEGVRGQITDINYNFKIKVSDYKRVIAVVDTSVNGQFFMAGSHFVTFDRKALPSSKVITWFKAPRTDDEDTISGNDDSMFYFDDLRGMNVSPAIADLGYEYYYENKVRYISLDGNKGYAIVEGREAYEVEFEYRNGEIRQLVCSCFCGYNCKHEFAAMLQLKDILKWIDNHYKDEFERTDYFAAMGKSILFAFAIENKENGTFTL